MSQHIAEIISVGTELLLGNVANTDARDISAMMSQLGLNVYYHTVVGDNDERLEAAVNIAKSRADVIITTGGLGPTYDDMTKQTLCRCFGRELKYDEAAAQEIRNYFARRFHNHNMSENNLLQAYLPEGCTVFHNTCGTAPGCAFEEGGVHVLMLPGPPRECEAMFRLSAMPYLRRLSEGGIWSHNVRIFGIGESNMENILHDYMVSLTNPSLAPYAKEGECLCRVTAKAGTEAEAEEMMAPVIGRVREMIRDFIYGLDVESIEERCLQLLKDAGMTFSCAESCTGGLIAKRITDIPGASAVFKGGAVTYTNEAKIGILGVDAGIIKEHFAVSRQTAAAMAEGARRVFSSDLAVSTTGIAGPDTDESGKPVGTVFVALSSPEGTWVRSLDLGTDRPRVRTVAAHHAFDMIRRYLTGLPVEL